MIHHNIPQDILIHSFDHVFIDLFVVLFVDIFTQTNVEICRYMTRRLHIYIQHKYVCIRIYIVLFSYIVQYARDCHNPRWYISLHLICLDL